MGDEHTVPVPPPPSSPDALEHAPSGDPTMWEQVADAFDRWREGRAPADDLVRLMTPVLWHVARACRLEEEAARDVLQTVWLALVRRRGEIRHPRAVASWLITATRREAWHVRSATTAAATTQAQVFEDSDWEQLLPPAPAAEAVAVERGEHAALWSAVQTLPERCQRLLRVIAFDDRPDYAHLSQQLGMPVGSIGPTRGRCLDKLRLALANATTGDR
ncbi:sigma-70 family RNA polymerase sigma factor [Serinibacter arcticus]|nr:sigma-70 family RNA polymerase sigma factor [Serinibacter arcticus]